MVREKTDLACEAAEALAMPFAFQLAIRRRDGLLFDRFVTPPALNTSSEGENRVQANHIAVPIKRLWPGDGSSSPRPRPAHTHADMAPTKLRIKREKQR